MTWREHAACIDAPTDWFFPRLPWDTTDRALALCMGCEVRVECLMEALAEETGASGREVVGIRGGLSAEERRVVLRKRRRIRTSRKVS